MTLNYEYILFNIIINTQNYAFHKAFALQILIFFSFDSLK